MNNFNFTKNPFINNDNTKIASKPIMHNNDGGRMSLDEVRDNMSALNRSNPEPKVEEQPKVIKTNDMQLQDTKNHLQALRNINRL
ncbi:MAG TPA: hypothetical protein PLV83_02985 [Bacilli bacterium]|nr:hypothetical protein [Bacilli bacterium]